MTLLWLLPAACITRTLAQRLSLGKAARAMRLVCSGTEKVISVCRHMGNSGILRNAGKFSSEQDSPVFAIVGAEDQGVRWKAGRGGKRLQFLHRTHGLHHVVGVFTQVNQVQVEPTFLIDEIKNFLIAW